MLIFIRNSTVKRFTIIGIILAIFIFGSYKSHNKVITIANLNSDEVELEKEVQKIFDRRNKAMHLKQWSEKQSVNFDIISSKVFLRNSKEIENGYQVSLAVTTEYIYNYEGSTAENSFGIGTYHSLDLIDKNGEWIVAREWYFDPFINSSELNEYNVEHSEGIILSSEVKGLPDIGYKRKSALEYADEYCGVARPPDYSFHYNKEYRNYNSQGGNCTNFVSQVIHAGGLEKNSTWNYKKGEATRAWVNAIGFNDYMLYSGRGQLIASGSYEDVLEKSYDLLPGDYIGYEKNGKVAHNAIVSGVDSKGYRLVNTNNPDFYRVPWDLGWNNEGVRFWLVRVNY